MLAIWKLASSGSQLEATQNRRRPQKTTMASNKKVSRLAATFRSGEGTSGPATANPALNDGRSFHVRRHFLELRRGFDFLGI